MSRRQNRYPDTWFIPAIYAGAAVAAGLTFPRLERTFLPELVAALSVSTATAVYGAVASGMIALTAIVFSLVFVMVQFSATAYSPRLVLWTARDPVMSHALGTFVATFLYAVAALAAIDRNNSGRVPFISAWLVILLLLASVAMFISLVERIGLLQVNRMLIFTGDQGREVIDSTYPSIESPRPAEALARLDSLPKTQSVLHRGNPFSIQALDVKKLVNIATKSGVVIESALAIGDTVMDSMPLLHVYGGKQQINERELLKAIELGAERTFKQDPKYAIRLLVDIAIRALSPAVNDPTTAVQALDQIEDLLLRLSRRRLEWGTFFDAQGQLRLIVPFTTWDAVLSLAFEEICAYGRDSMQVMRRMNALVNDLLCVVPEERRPALAHWQQRLREMVVRSFPNAYEQAESAKPDRQGLGGAVAD